MGNVVAIIVAALGGGGVFAFATAWMDGRRQAKQRDDEAPERRESLTVEGSAKAVLTMSDALEAANQRAEQAEEDVKALREDIRRMKSEHRQEIDELRTELDTIRGQLRDAYNAKNGTA